MKIWIQSASAMGTDPLWDDYGEALERHAKKLAREDSTITFSGVKIMTPALEKHYYFQLLNTPQIVENAIIAEREGYDAFAGNCLLDPGLHEIREILHIPSIFIGEASLLFACMLGGKFSLISHNPNYLEMMNKKVLLYGLEKRAAPPQTFKITLTELAQSFKNPDKVAEEFTKAAKRAVENGAEVLVPGCNVLNMFCVSNGIREIDGMVVLDAFSVLIKTVEMMVDLEKKTGLSVSRRYHYCQPDDELLATVRKSYSLA